MKRRRRPTNRKVEACVSNGFSCSFGGRLEFAQSRNQERPEGKQTVFGPKWTERRREGGGWGGSRYNSKDYSPTFKSKLPKLVFCKVDLGGIILAGSFYEVLRSPEVPDGEKEAGCSKLAVKPPSDKQRQ